MAQSAAAMPMAFRLRRFPLPFAEYLPMQVHHCLVGFEWLSESGMPGLTGHLVIACYPGEEHQRIGLSPGHV
jgi:hypothetical protein